MTSTSIMETEATAAVVSAVVETVVVYKVASVAATSHLTMATYTGMNIDDVVTMTAALSAKIAGMAVKSVKHRVEMIALVVVVIVALKSTQRSRRYRRDFGQRATAGNHDMSLTIIGRLRPGYIRIWD